MQESFFLYVQQVLGFVGQGDDGGFGNIIHGRNEASRRYVTSEPEFYIPEVWRSAPENKKQGSGGPWRGTLQQGDYWTGQTLDSVATPAEALNMVINHGLYYYKAAMEAGICAEQARLFLPMYGLQTVWRWSASLQAVAFFLTQRFGDDAQWETQQYAGAVYGLTKPFLQESLSRLIPENLREKGEELRIEVEFSQEKER